MRSMPVRNLSPRLTAALAVRSSAAAALQKNNAAYLKHWLTKLKEEPAFWWRYWGREQGGEDDCRQGNRTDKRTRSSLKRDDKEQEYKQTGGAVRPH